VHYDDLKADLPGEMRRIANFLGIPVPPDLWPGLVAAAGFEAMRRDGDALMGSVVVAFQGGSSRFFVSAASPGGPRTSRAVGEAALWIS
jgi:aryl sulfotransferase